MKCQLKILSVLLGALVSATLALADEGEPGVFVLGGTRGVGLEIVKRLEIQGDAVTVLVRSSSDLTALAKTNAVTVTGDALDRASIDAALKTGRFRAVVSTLSGKSGGRYADSEGNINAMDASVDAGIQRFVLISSIGVGNSREALPWIARLMLGGFLENKGAAENHLMAGPLDYTVIRPGNLNNDEPSGNAILTEDPSASGGISRASVAQLTVDILDDPRTTGKIYSAVED